MIRRLSIALGELERQALCADILRLSAETPSFASNNRGGWRSPGTWLNTTWMRSRILAVLASVPELDIDPATLQGWAVVNRKGSYHRLHVHHAKYAWSGIVYLDRGGEPSAATEFEWYPRPTQRMYERVEPEIGSMVVFPASLAHGVEEHRGDGARITVAFDVKRRRGSVGA